MKYRIGLVGCGAISKKHIQALTDAGDMFDFVAICDLDSGRARKLAEDYTEKTGSSLLVYKDHTEMLSKENLDVVSVATSSNAHYKISMDAISAGCNVILEKPIALSTTHAREVVENAETAGLKLAVCYITRYAPHVRMIKETISEGNIGKVLHGAIQLRWNRGDDYYRSSPWRGTWGKDGGMLMNQASHGIDLLLWLMDHKVESVFCSGRRFQRPIESEDFAGAIVQFRGGAVALVEATVNVSEKNLDQILSVFGEKGTVVMDGTHLGAVNTLRIEGNEKLAGEIAGLATQNTVIGHALLYQDFFDALKNDRQPLVSGREGLRSLELILASYKSMKMGRSASIPVDFATHEMEDIWNS